jgi:hypothetical protein
MTDLECQDWNLIIWPSGTTSSQLDNKLMAGTAVISSNVQALAQLASAIERRFGANYAVVALDASEVSKESLAYGPIAIALAPIGTEDFASMRDTRSPQVPSQSFPIPLDQVT